MIIVTGHRGQKLSTVAVAIQWSTCATQHKAPEAFQQQHNDMYRTLSMLLLRVADPLGRFVTGLTNAMPDAKNRLLTNRNSEFGLDSSCT